LNLLLYKIIITTLIFLKIKNKLLNLNLFNQMKVLQDKKILKMGQLILSQTNINNTILFLIFLISIQVKIKKNKKINFSLNYKIHKKIFVKLMWVLKSHFK